MSNHGDGIGFIGAVVGRILNNRHGRFFIVVTRAFAEGVLQRHSHVGAKVGDSVQVAHPP